MKADKKRFYEIMNKVNKITLNEDFDNTDSSKDIVYSGIKKLMGGKFKQKNGGSYSVDIDSDANNMSINLTGNDSDNNTYEFVFEIIGDENLDDSVIAIDNIQLTSFQYTPSNGEVVEFSPDRLQFFNQQDNPGLYDVLEDYLGRPLSLNECTEPSFQDSTYSTVSEEKSLQDVYNDFLSLGGLYRDKKIYKQIITLFEELLADGVTETDPLEDVLLGFTPKNVG
jgi:hypothetical protein